MFKNILIPTDGSDLAVKGVEQGILFAKEIGAKITAVMVTEPFHLVSVAPSQLEYTPIEYKKHAEAHAKKVLGTVSVAAKLADVACETLHVEHDHIYEAIIDAASARRCDLIVMASHGEDPRTRVSLRVSLGIHSVFLRHRRLGRRAQCLGVSPVLR
jgi:nucleotide-binding universal stress UspA family protein